MQYKGLQLLVFLLLGAFVTLQSQNNFKRNNTWGADESNINYKNMNNLTLRYTEYKDRASRG